MAQILNIVPITFNTDKIKVGRMPKMDSDEYRQLRETHWKTHSFRYDHRFDEVMNIALDEKEAPIGQEDVVNIDEHLLLVARAVQQSILIWLADELTILRGSKRLVFWGQADSALLLSRALKKVGLEPIPNLEVVLRYEIDCRMFRYSGEQLYLGLVIDVSTSNIIDIPISELLEQGLRVNGRYVCRRQEGEHEYLLPRLELLGKVGSISSSRLLLTDTDGVDEI